MIGLRWQPFNSRAMRTGSNIFEYPPAAIPAVPSLACPYKLSPGDAPDNGPREPDRFGSATGPREDLPYKIELWEEGKKRVEQVLAVTANGSIGYAAYYAATREYPDR